MLGGGVLGWGCVQEEIRMLVSPELLLSRLFTEELDANEALVMTGFERYSDYSGYAGTFRWRGDYREVDNATVRDAWGRRRVELVAIDALAFRCVRTREIYPLVPEIHRSAFLVCVTNARSSIALDQFRPDMVAREMNKALAGFQANSFEVGDRDRLSAVATGNWGCGAFHGHLQLKGACVH